MKKLLPLTLLFLIYFSLLGQTEELNNTQSQKPKYNLISVTYQLYPTQNMWTFLKLNTRNGKIWQVQYSVEGDDRFETYLNLLPLIHEENEVNNRFILYPTQNMWTFILLDQIDGKTWQVQWSTEPKNRNIWPIE